MKFSVIMRCRNEARWVGYALQSCLELLDNPEIVFIDNQSSDDSRDVVRMFEHHSDFKFIDIHNYSPGRAINIGVQESKHSNILILSAHCILKSFNAKHYIDDLKTYVAIFGNQIPVYRGRKIQKRYVWSHFIEEKVVDMFSEIENRPFLHNAMCVYKRAFLLEYKFDELLYSKEDRYWANNVLNYGYHYLYDPTMICEHHWTEEGATWKGIG